MKKILAVFSLLIATIAIVWAAAPTKTVEDACYVSGPHINFAGQTTQGCTFGKFNKVHSDSVIGATDSRTLFSHFIPKQGWEYVLCRDTIGSYVHLKRDTSNVVFVLYAYSADSSNRLIGKTRVDSMGGTGSGTLGSVPQQILLPFGSTIVGDYYTLKAECNTAKDSIWFNFFYLVPRSTVLRNNP
jgi:hypothetical protein